MLKKIALQPGIQREGTQYSAEGYWYDSDKVRFRQGRPEKIGGWVRPSSNTFLGVSRALHNWSSIDRDDYLAIGTNKKSYIEIGGTCYDVTPKRYKSTTRLTFDAAPSDSAEPALAAGATSIRTQAALANGSFIRIDNEYIKVASDSSGGGPYTATIERAKYGTADVAHNSGSAVFEIESIDNPIGVIGDSNRVLIKDDDHGAYEGDYITFLYIADDTGIDTTGITRAKLLSSYSTSTSTQGFQIVNVLNSDYYEIEVPGSTGSTVQTTLHSNISSSDSSIRLASDTGIVANSLVKINDEYVQLGALDASTDTYSSSLRGQLGSQSSAHSAGDKVNLITTSAVDSGTFSLRGGSPCHILYDTHAAASEYVDGSGWGSGRWSGRPDVFVSTTLDGSITNSAVGDISVADEAGFSASSSNNGTLLIESELLIYEGTGSDSLDIKSGGRGALGTTAAAHPDKATVFDVTSAWIAWGEGNTSSSSTSIRVWSVDNFGEDLILAPRDGAPYYWNKSQRADGSIPSAVEDSATAGVNDGIINGSAVPMSSMGLSSEIVTRGYDIGQGAVPDQVRIMMVHPVVPIILAFGCTDTFGNFDPLLVRWSDSDRPGSWDTVGGNDAGGTPLSTGSEIIGAARSKREILIWTDEAAYAMRYAGDPDIFSFAEVASGVSIVAQNAYGVSGDRIFWMGDRNFYMYDGNVTVLPCTVLDYVFSDLDYGARQKIFCARNSSFGEISWFYQTISGNPSDINKYVTYNYIENSWVIGTMDRTSWSDSGIRQYPYASYIDPSETTRSFLYQQERGADGDGAAIHSYIESGFIDIDDGDQLSFISRVIPDVRYSSGGELGLDIKITPRDFPNSNDGTTSTSRVTSTTGESRVRVRGRQMKVRFDSNDSGVSWTCGDTRIGIQPDGRR
jgi:hypothetical protein